MPSLAEIAEKISKTLTIHGDSGTKTYRIWVSMRHRCNNPNNPYYGGRGIKVCKRWKYWKNFLTDMGKCPEGLMLDRTNNDGNYELSNCKWVSARESARNRRFASSEYSRKTSLEDDKEIADLRSNGFLLQEIADMYNISETTVRVILKRIKGRDERRNNVEI